MHVMPDICRDIMKLGYYESTTCWWLSSAHSHCDYVSGYCVFSHANILRAIVFTKMLVTLLTLVVKCKSLPTWNGMVVNTTSRVWRTVVNTSCSKDQMLPQWVDYRILTCEANGEWQPAMQECVGTQQLSCRCSQL